MPRPAWTPKTTAQRDALEAAVRASEKAAAAEKELWKAIWEARELDVPDSVLCEETGESRSTLNRKLGRRANPKRPAD